MDDLKITKKSEPISFSIRIDKAVADYYDELARITNRSRNEVISMALEYAKDKIFVEDL